MKVFAGGVRIYPHDQSVKMARSMGTQIPGYAKGGTISATGKGSIASVIGKAFLDGLEGTTGQIKDAIVNVLWNTPWWHATARAIMGV